MPPKTRIIELSFQKALCSLDVNQIADLFTSPPSGSIWNELCILMDKATSIENTRACYDIWKQNRYQSHEIVNKILKRTEQTSICNGIDEIDLALNKTDSLLQNSETRPSVIYTTENNLQKSTNNNDDNLVSINKKPMVSKHIVDQVRLLISQQTQQIVLVEEHHCNTHCCEQDIGSIRIVYKCSNEDDLACTMNQGKKNENVLLNDIQIKEVQEDADISSMTSDHNHDKPSDEVISTGFDSIEILHESDESSSSKHSPLRLKVSPASSLTTSPSLEYDGEVHLDESGNSPLYSHQNRCAESDISSQIQSVQCISHGHEQLDDAQKSVLRRLQRRSNDTGTFEMSVAGIQGRERENITIISQTDMNLLKGFQKEKKLKNKDVISGADLSGDSLSLSNQRSLQWTVIIDRYLKHSNDYCVFIYDRHYFTKRTTVLNSDQFFMSIDGHCKFTSCTCRFHAIIKENGHLQIDYSGKIVHDSDETHARPIRSTRRDELRQITTFGTTPAALQLHQLATMTSENKEAGNRNNIGSSPSVIRKISSEANVKLRRDKDLNRSLYELKSEFGQKIFPAEQIPGYIQEISVDPLRIICFTAGGVSIYHKFATSMPLSWDATGGIVVNKDKKIYYYELTMSNMNKGRSSLPITTMLSASHGTMDVVHWMNCFVEKYKQVYGYSHPFPKPPIIHSDRSLVFLIAGIQIFNRDETMDSYIERCWRIVRKCATKRDLEITIVHACLGHFMKNVKTQAGKDLNKKQVPFGMWLVALLVNSNTLEEICFIWRNICMVLLSPAQNDQFKICLSTLSKLADEMNKDPDKTNFVLQNVSISTVGHCTTTLLIAVRIM